MKTAHHLQINGRVFAQNIGTCLLIILLPHQSVVGSSQNVIDSLETLLLRPQEDTTIVNLNNQLSKCYRYKSTDRSSEYANLAYNLAVKIDFVPGLATSLNFLGILKEINGDYDGAITDYMRAMKLNERMGSKSGVASSLGNLGVTYYYMDKYKKAKEYFQLSLEIRLELDDQEELAGCYNNIAIIHYAQNEYKEALNYYNKSLLIRKELKNQADIAESLNNIGVIHEELKDYPMAIDYYNRSLKIHLEMNSPSDISRSYFNISAVYEQKLNFTKSLEYLDKSLEAVKNLETAEMRKEIFKSYSSVYLKMGKYKDAFRYQSRYFTLKDSIMSEELYSQIAEMETKYETEKMETEIALMRKQQELDETEHDAEVNRQRLMTGFSVIAFILMAVIGVFIYNRYRLKRKALVLLSVKNKQITDSINYARRIQEAILPTDEMIKDEWPDSFVYYVPKATVSGDFYWFSHHNDKSFIASVDCTGHGVPGAFMSMIGNTLLNEIIHEKEVTDPAEILKLLHDGVVSSLKQGGDSRTASRDGMDIAFCTVDKAGMKLQYAGANNSLYMIRDGKLTETRGDQLVIGDNRFGSDYTNHEIQLKKGDCIYTFTDGYADQFGGPKNKKFYYKPFQELLIKNSPLPMREQKIILEEVMDTWKGEGTQIDDMLIVGFRI